MHVQSIIYNRLRVFLTEESARISPCLEGLYASHVRKFNIFNIRENPSLACFGKLACSPKTGCQAGRALAGDVKLGFSDDFREDSGVSSFIIKVIPYATLPFTPQIREVISG